MSALQSIVGLPLSSLAPLYDRITPPTDPAQLRERLRLPTIGRLLDAGGGTGRVSSLLRRLMGDVIISDLSRPMVQPLHRKGRL